MPAKLRMTNQRRVILEELGKINTHPTADQVYQMVRRRMPRISLGTVYRNLEVLSQCGKVLKLELGGSQRRFDGDASPHYHIRCQKCGQIQDLPVVPMQDIEDRLAPRTDFVITSHRLEILGYCPQCYDGSAKAPADVLQNA